MTLKTLTHAAAVILCGSTLAFAHPTPGTPEESVGGDDKAITQPPHGLGQLAPGLAIKVADASHAMSPNAKTTEVHTVGDLEIKEHYARATPPNAPVSAGYMTIRNNGSAPDRLIGAVADFAGKVEIHEMTMDGDIMRMREIEGGLEIPAGGEVVLEPGGLHVMFMQLGEPLTAGEIRNVTLHFENAGSIEMAIPVQTVKRGSAATGSFKHEGSH